MISTTLNTIAEAHRWLISNIIWDHQVITTEDNEQTWEGQAVAVTINQPLTEMIHPLSSFQEQRCKEYAEQLIEGVKTDLAEDKKFTYTYHERLYLNSQFDEVLSRLKFSLATRRAVLYTWLPPLDGIIKDVPCLQMVQFLFRKDLLHMTVYFRSNDVLSAAGPNMYANVRLLEHVAAALCVPVGTYTHIVTVPHLYPVRDAADLKRWM